MPAGLPICVDLDGTLLRIDTLHEAAAGMCLADPRAALRLPAWLAAGKLRVKAELARRWVFDPATLPYSPELLTWLRARRAEGARLVLCTAAHRTIAERIAAHLGLFDEVIAADAACNPRGAAKAERLCRRFGRGGFVYAGNDATDLVVWDRAAAAVVVNASAGTRRRALARHPDALVLDRPHRLRAALRAVRAHQWLKNTLCLVPPLAAGDFVHAAAWSHAALVMLGFCLVASTVYLLNDLSDLAADRAHPRKANRPTASGALPVAAALPLAALLLVGGMACGWAGNGAGPIAAYLAVTCAYSVWLKRLPLVDVFVLAGLYTLRLFGGGEASGHAVSLWLLGFSSFLFLGLALVKRVAELQRLPPPGTALLAGRGYQAGDLPTLRGFGWAASFTSTVVLALYVQSDTASRAYGHPALLWVAVPLLLLWQCRLWLATARGEMADDPVVYAARDRATWLVLAVLTAAFGAAWLP